MEQDLFGLSTEQWTAWERSPSSWLAGWAIFLNGRASRHAKDAAEASEAGAEAARDAVVVQTAGLEIKFSLYVRFSKGALMALATAPITLTCGANLFMHELRLMRMSYRLIRRVDLPCPVESM